MSTPHTTDVVVVGAGPVGLVAACELARRGVAVRIIDKLPRPTEESRAIAIHARSLDMLDRMGIVDQMVGTGVKSTGMKMYAGAKPLFHVPMGDVDGAFPYMLITAQTETERVLTERLTELGVTIERGVELTGLAQSGPTVSSTVRREDGSVEQIDASWVIGTDGGHSTVRHLVGTKLAGSFQGERFVLGDVEAQHSLDNASGYTFFSPQGPVVTLPMRGGRVRFLAQIHDAAGARPEPAPHPGTTPDDSRPADRGDHHHHIALVDLLRGAPRSGARVPLRSGLPGRRCGPHPQPGRRTGHEHRYAGCVQPRLEAGHGDPGGRR